MRTAAKGLAEQPEKATRIQEANRATILNAALDVFSAYGFRGATIDQIAVKAAMSKQNLLYYFPSKRAVYTALLENTLAEWLEPLAGFDPDGEPLHQIEAYIARKMELSAQKPEASRLFANEILHGAPSIGPFLKTRLKDLVDEKAIVLKGWMDEGKLAAVDPHLLIFSIWAITQHYADFDVQIKALMGKRAAAPSFEREARNATISLILNGVVPRTEGPS